MSNKRGRGKQQQQQQRKKCNQKVAANSKKRKKPANNLKLALGLGLSSDYILRKVFRKDGPPLGVEFDHLPSHAFRFCNYKGFYFLILFFSDFFSNYMLIYMI